MKGIHEFIFFCFLAFTREEVASILDLAKASDLEVIPLVQTFGHMEFALKLEEFKPLREVPFYPQVRGL